MYIFALTILTLVVIQPQEKLQQPKDPDLSGYYSCSGKDNGGATYHGVVMLHKVKQVYVVQWVVGGSVSVGIGQQSGAVFVVGWKTETGKTFGCTLYRIGKDTLTGTYVSNGTGGEALSEVLTLLQKLPPMPKGDI